MNIEGLTLGGVVLIGLKMLADSISHRGRKKDATLEESIHGVIRLETKMESFEKYLERIPKMEKDINEAHQKLREIKTKLDGSLS